MKIQDNTNGISKNFIDLDLPKQSIQHIQNHQFRQRKSKFHQGLILITIMFTIFLLNAFIVESTTHILKYNREESTLQHQNNNKNVSKSKLMTESAIVSEQPLRFIYRHQWFAAPPMANLTDLELPVKIVIIAHTASEGCQTQAQCVLRVRAIQDFHMESHNWLDIGYNFLIGGDGSVYEGRGWNKEGAHTKNYNKQSICIAFIGTFNTIKPSSKMLNATLILLNEGVKENKLDLEYKLYGHRQLMATSSPGDKLFNIITEWEHFSNDI